MAFKVEVVCPKCEKEFEVKSECLPLEDKSGFGKEVTCPHCGKGYAHVAIEVRCR